EKHQEQNEQAAVATSPASGTGAAQPDRHPPERRQPATGQQAFAPAPELPVMAPAADMPVTAFTSRKQAPELLLVPFLETNTPGVTTAPDSTDRPSRQVIRKRSIPVAMNFSAGKKRKAARAAKAETNEGSAGAAEPATTAKTTAAGLKQKKTPDEELALGSATLTVSAVAAVKKSTRPAPPEKRVSSRNEWTAGLYFAPRYAFRKFVPNASDDILITGVHSANQLDPERMGYEYGATYSRVVAPGLFLEGGISWMQLKENVAYTLTTGKIDTFSVSQTGSGQLVVETKLQTEDRQLISSYAYGGLRLGATYYFMERKGSRLNITVAGGANLLIKGTTRQYSNGEWRETVVFPSKENILEQSNYNLLLGVGYNVSLLQHYELSLMPAFNYFLGSTFKEREPLGLKPYSLGLNIQLKRRFNR
ncbi:MAG: hypothetical protein LPK07_16295, partial [Hymenobacteraceae bacterium]|nr:hypothetical protein [Hymenobacteraceae bacterium]